MISKLPSNLSIRNSKPSDHGRIMRVMKDWWDGRDLTWMLPKLFLNHFNNTSYVIEKNDDLMAFLIGFLSQSNTNEGYIHFAGVHPDYRGIGIGRYLYENFFTVCKKNKRDTIKSCTSPINKGSIKFHKKMGFGIEQGNAEIDGISVTLDYNKPNDAKVLFKKKIIDT
ncbi:MAG: GNAT family N-acetyltransferase [Deltaproteobacteria bacterium]|nr:GNAT family N-acetyltransferase [Deltaproteobacteria bacterium]MBT8375090.1 GNAT family N-acetyltransferase [Deltaproteobacteria bacterium]NNK84302.1 GNAT family N-acetyltransferase [Desulfobacterales bacterium]